MRYIDVNDEYVSQILALNNMAKDSLNEGKMPAGLAKALGKDEDKKDKNKKPEDKPEDKSCESTELHECPLCESQLEEALTVEQIQEHIDYILETITEAEEFEGEDLDEKYQDDEEEEDEEDDQ